MAAVVSTNLVGRKKTQQNHPMYKTNESVVKNQLTTIIFCCGTMVRVGYGLSGATILHAVRQ